MDAVCLLDSDVSIVLRIGSPRSSAGEESCEKIENRVTSHISVRRSAPLHPGGTRAPRAFSAGDLEL
jgi:hypothetical protein